MDILDSDDQLLDDENRWGQAIEAWREGDPERLAEQLHRLSIPLFAREFLADLASGDAKRRMGRPSELSGPEERNLFVEVMRAWETGTIEVAIASVAERRGMSEGQVRGHIDRLRREGLNRTLWKTGVLGS